MKRVGILGSTGSIGTQTLAVLRQFPEDFRVVALSGGQNVDSLADQIQMFHPEHVVTGDEILFPHSLRK